MSVSMRHLREGCSFFSGGAPSSIRFFVFTSYYVSRLNDRFSVLFRRYYKFLLLTNISGNIIKRRKQGFAVTLKYVQPPRRYVVETNLRSRHHMGRLEEWYRARLQPSIDAQASVHGAIYTRLQLLYQRAFKSQ